MSSLSSWIWGTTQLDDAVDKATSELLPTDAEDIALNLEICDQIRSKSVPAKDAMRALKRRLNHKNPNVQLLALGLTDICIKNGGDQFLTEVASREFIDNLVSILKIPGLNIDVKNKMLRLIQNWAVAFEGKALLGYVGQVYKTLKSEGFNFPPQDLVVANSAMVDTQTAPEWVDSDICLRCRDPFTFTNRKHHCRNCGQVFDQKCSSKMMPLPHFGITQDVRVCDSCFAKLGKKGERAPGVDKSHRRSASAHSSRHRSARELADAELQRAIQLSLESAGLTSRRPGYIPYQPSNSWHTSEPPLVDRSSHPYAVSDRKSPEPVEDDDPDLKAAIEASLREANAPKPSAPIVLETPRSEEPSFTFGRGPGYSQSYPPTSIPEPSVPKLPNYDLEPLESDAILTFSQTVEQVQAQGGRDVSRYPAVNELFDKANGLRPKLAMSLDDTGRKEQMLAEMHDKLSQAVKLYDQLLTQQISHPAWRSPYQRSGYMYDQPSNQWAPVSPQAPPMAPTNYQQQVQSPVPPIPVQTQPLQTSLTRAQTFPQGADNAQQPRYPQPTQFSEEPYQTPYAQPPSQFTMQAPMQSPTTYNLTTNGVPVASPPPPPFYPTQSPSLPMVVQSPAPVSKPQHSPQQLPSAPHPVVSSPPLAPVNRYPSRANTIPHMPAPQQPTLPAFPVAPTTVPESFSAYGSTIPTPQPERKEALLIDL